MFAFYVISFLVLLGLSALAYSAYYVINTKRVQNAEDRKRFRTAVVHRLQKHGTKGFDYNKIVEECEVPPSLASEVAEEIFSLTLAKSVLDGTFTDVERKKMDRLAEAFAIAPAKARTIEERLKRNHYVTAVEKALADGIITEQEKEELKLLRQNFGLSSSLAVKLAADRVKDGYLALFRNVVSDGQITDNELKELMRFRDAFGLSIQDAQAIVRPDAHSLYSKVYRQVILDGFISEAEQEQLRRYRMVLGLSNSEVSQIEESLKRKHYSGALEEALSDDKLSEKEKEDLRTLRNNLGLRQNAASEIAASRAKDAYVALFRAVVSDGQITNDELKELTRFRDALGLSLADSQAYLKPEAERIYSVVYSRCVADGVISTDEQEQLRRYRFLLGLSDHEAAQLVTKQAIHIYREIFYEICQDADIAVADEDRLNRLAANLMLDEESLAPYRVELAEKKRLSEFRRGNLPSLQTTRILDSGEICHWISVCTYWWRTQTMAKSVSGELLVTSERIIFTSPTRSFELRPSKILDVQAHTNGLTLTTSVTKAAGDYLTSQARRLEAILIGVIRKHKYLQAESFSATKTRHIPDAVKREVWARDGGCCVRCRATEYLEFDHIIPFSKGGANTEKNIQLLCRGCNAIKSDRI
ncbi:MAG: hypothetical protein EXS16_15955 [Gemmataceae bacterium]|nr:hypothetical protein [Gemmataceae bacterium]